MKTITYHGVICVGGALAGMALSTIISFGVYSMAADKRLMADCDELLRLDVPDAADLSPMYMLDEEIAATVVSVEGGYVATVYCARLPDGRIYAHSDLSEVRDAIP
jgi:hypothetical protein